MDHRVLRCFVVALMMLALSLAGIGRGLAAASVSGPPLIIIDGFVISFCHTGDSSGSQNDPQNSANHDCCDQCTLGASVDVPIARVFSRPDRIVHLIKFDSTVAGIFGAIRSRTPRLSQGPPRA